MKKNRYAMKRRHKLELQKSYMLGYSHGRNQSLKLFADELREIEDRYADTLWGRKHPARNGGYEYWKKTYLTGSRQVAKKYSDKRIRQKYRRLIHHMDPEDVTLPQGADYEKEFDYIWTVW